MSGTECVFALEHCAMLNELVSERDLTACRWLPFLSCILTALSHLFLCLLTLAGTFYQNPEVIDEDTKEEIDILKPMTEEEVRLREFVK